jgi:hypothetical protein
MLSSISSEKYLISEIQDKCSNLADQLYKAKEGYSPRNSLLLKASDLNQRLLSYTVTNYYNSTSQIPSEDPNPKSPLVAHQFVKEKTERLKLASPPKKPE